MRVVAFGITLVGVSVVGLGVVHKLLAYLLIDVVNGFGHLHGPDAHHHPDRDR